MKPETQEVRRLVQKIIDLEEDIANLADEKRIAEMKLDDLVIGSANKGLSIVEEKPVARRGRVESETSAKRLIEKLLNENPANDYDGDSVSQEIGINVGTARTNLSKLVGLGLIEKRSSSTYGAITRAKEEEASPEEIAS